MIFLQGLLTRVYMLLINQGGPSVWVCVRYNFDEFVDTLLRYGVTHAPLVPPILLQLVKNNLGEHFDRTKLKLKTVLTAAAPLGTELQKAFESKFPGVEVQQVMQQITLPRNWVNIYIICRHGCRFHDMSSYIFHCPFSKWWTVVKPPKKPETGFLDLPTYSISTYLSMPQKSVSLQSCVGLALISPSLIIYRTPQNLTACMVGVQMCRRMDWLSTAASPSRTVIQVMADGLPSLDLLDSLFQGSSSNSSTNTPDSRCLSTNPGSCVSVASLAWKVRKFSATFRILVNLYTNFPFSTNGNNPPSSDPQGTAFHRKNKLSF